MSVGSSAGTLSSAARTMVAVRSSGRRSLSDPLNARPMGERAVATMTASGMGSSTMRRVRGRAGGDGGPPQLLHGEAPPAGPLPGFLADRGALPPLPPP